YRNVPNRVLASVSPLNTALCELNFTCAVDVPFTTGSATGLQAMICPPSEEKMNSAGALPALDLILKPLVGLNTCPVGLESMGGRVTTRGTRVAMAPPGLLQVGVDYLRPHGREVGDQVGLAELVVVAVGTGRRGGRRDGHGQHGRDRHGEHAGGDGSESGQS